MYKFSAFLVFLLFFSSCGNTEQQKAPNPNVDKELIKDATTKLDDLIPRIVQVDVSNLLEDGQKLSAINFLINGIGYPTKLEENGTVLINIAGVEAGVHQFKARMAFSDKTESQREFVVKIDDEMELLAPMK